ncbi:D-amino acid aminotransferase [Thalassotalea mangrovi]|uniref:Aminodeoxychorismate lyase n=1 Tax=Thalassotalea mangrovi TaxID=2572245 RepID=A0A4U1B323_9GAMM|nr:D-amino acid aminotransferase [Thalassotalea mangrovi]TKB43450.1 D-amino acid aminotransferase [Thalassotalea mangrovi]
MTDTVFLNGDYVAKANAKISVLDRGFLFADGVYEVIPVYRGKPFRVKEHLNRLFDSLRQINLSSPYSESQWLEIITRVIVKNLNVHGDNQSIYLQVTRGIDSDRQHTVSGPLPATVLVMASKLTTGESTLKGEKATLLEDIRWLHCDIKSIALLANTLLVNQAKANGFDEAILHRQQWLTEGASSNVFLVNNGQVLTPPKSQYILGGITRDLIIELCQASGLEVCQRRVHIKELLDADEVWICSSTREISPIIAIDDKIIGSGRIGATTRRMAAALQAFKSELL